MWFSEIKNHTSPQVVNRILAESNPNCLTGLSIIGLPFIIALSGFPSRPA